MTRKKSMTSAKWICPICGHRTGVRIYRPETTTYRHADGSDECVINAPAEAEEPAAAVAPVSGVAVALGGAVWPG